MIIEEEEEGLGSKFVPRPYKYKLKGAAWISHVMSVPNSIKLHIFVRISSQQIVSSIQSHFYNPF